MDLEIEAPIDELEAVEAGAEDDQLGDATVLTCIPALCTTELR